MAVPRIFLISESALVQIFLEVLPLLLVITISQLLCTHIDPSSVDVQPIKWAPGNVAGAWR
jgi:hypothetical protein